MSFFYPFKVNVALAGFGADPTKFDGKWRSEMQQECKRAGLTPQEAALIIIVRGMSIRDYPPTSWIVLQTFIREGSVDPSKPQVNAAIDTLSLM